MTDLIESYDVIIRKSVPVLGKHELRSSDMGGGIVSWVSSIYTHLPTQAGKSTRWPTSTPSSTQSPVGTCSDG